MHHPLPLLCILFEWVPQTSKHDIKPNARRLGLTLGNLQVEPYNIPSNVTLIGCQVAGIG